MFGILIKGMKKKLYIAGIAICAIVFCVSVFKVIDYHIKSRKAALQLYKKIIVSMENGRL